MNTNNQLKPCPFCGSEMLKVEVTDHGQEKRPFGFRWTAKVVCLDCFSSCGTHGFQRNEENGKRIAIRAWNRRAAMNPHDATEQAYRNGYEVGYNKGWISGCEQAMKGIVLCKDCKHYSPDNKKGLLHNPCSRIFAMSICEEDSFCSYGERKED